MLPPVAKAARIMYCIPDMAAIRADYIGKTDDNLGIRALPDPGCDRLNFYRGMTMLIYKICHAAEWAEAERGGAYAGSAKDRADDFLHFSTAEQVPGTLERYYAGADDLVLVAVDPTPLGAALKYEPASNGALYPHLYANLPLTAVRWAKAHPPPAREIML